MTHSNTPADSTSYRDAIMQMIKAGINLGLHNRMLKACEGHPMSLRVSTAKLVQWIKKNQQPTKGKK